MRKKGKTKKLVIECIGRKRGRLRSSSESKKRKKYRRGKWKAEEQMNTGKRDVSDEVLG